MDVVSLHYHMDATDADPQLRHLYTQRTARHLRFFTFEQFIPYFYLLITLEQVIYLLFLLYFVRHYERTRVAS